MDLAIKLHILSDLHTEFADFVPPATGADVVVLAGDIGVGTAGLEWAARQFPGTPLIYVPGNHEYYDHSLDLVDDLRASAPGHIHVLDNDALELDSVRFLGTTLWTDFRLYGEGEAWFARQRATRGMRDFTVIRKDDQRFTPEDSVQLHEASRAWLDSELQSDFNGPTVVVTHHLPAWPSISKRYANDPLNPAFASSLEEIIEHYRPDLWIHGHTHVPCDYELFGTRVICNPRGYPGEPTGFSPGLVVEV